MKQIRCIVIDDEPMALEKLEAYIRKVPFLKLVAPCESPFEAMPFLTEQQVDAMFIDINMPDLNGMDFIASLPASPLIVFTTAYAEYAVKSYQFAAVDYLLKPFDFSTFQRAANKLYKIMAPADKFEGSDNDTIYVKVDYRYVNIKIADIVYVKGMNEYVQLFVTGGKPLVAYITLKQIKERFPAYFLQVHRSYIVNMRQVKEIERLRIVFSDGTRVPVSENYKKSFMDYMNLHSLNKSLTAGKCDNEN